MSGEEDVGSDYSLWEEFEAAVAKGEGPHEATIDGIRARAGQIPASHRQKDAFVRCAIKFWGGRETGEAEPMSAAELIVLHQHEPARDLKTIYLDELVRGAFDAAGRDAVKTYLNIAHFVSPAEACALAQSQVFKKETEGHALTEEDRLTLDNRPWWTRPSATRGPLAGPSL